MPINSLTVVKIGGNVVDDPAALARFLNHFAALPSPKLLVHGGGKIATQLADRLGVPTRLVHGRRLTDQPTLDIAVMTYAGLVNKTIVAGLGARGCVALGLTGADANTVQAHRRPVGEVDYGLVADLEGVNAAVIGQFLSLGLTPVFAPIARDAMGQLLNVNADTLASTMATGLAAHFAVSLLYCFEKHGVLADPTDDQSVIGQLDAAGYRALKSSGAVSAGMLPKLDNAFAARRTGVARVVICHADALAHWPNGGVGTALD